MIEIRASFSVPVLYRTSSCAHCLRCSRPAMKMPHIRLSASEISRRRVVVNVVFFLDGIVQGQEDLMAFRRLCYNACQPCVSSCQAHLFYYTLVCQTMTPRVGRVCCKPGTSGCSFFRRGVDKQLMCRNQEVYTGEVRLLLTFCQFKQARLSSIRH
jgi:hypothetical protein